jgi:hypothetical protein
MVLPIALGVVAWRALDDGARDGAGFAVGGAEKSGDAQATRSQREATASLAGDRRAGGSGREGLSHDVNGARVEGAAVDGAMRDGIARREGEARASATNGAACAQHPVKGSNVATLASGRRALELGDRGLAVLEKGAEVQLDATDPCRLALQLVRGRVTVHARDLMGGELRVRAGSTDVVVHGTTFAVARDADEVSVDVAEGAVAVERDGRAVTPLIRTGQRLQLAVRQAPVIAALSQEAVTQLRAAVSEKIVLGGADSSAALSPGASAADERGASESAPQLAAADTTRIPRGLEPNASSHARSRRSSASASAATRSGSEDWGSGGGPSSRAASETFGRSMSTRRGSRGSAADASARTAARAGYEARARSRGASESESADDDSPTSEAAQAVGSDAWKRALAGSESSRAVAQAKPARSELSRPITSTYGVDEDVTAPQPSAAAGAAAPAPNAPASVRPAPDTTASSRAETPAELVARADRMWRSGSRDDARALYRRAGTLSGATAQAAWLALARRELSAGRSSAAREALESYKTRFPSGALGEEAAGIEFRIALLEHDDALAGRLAQQLRDRHPGSPAAQAATRWLRSRGHTP